MSLLAVLLAAVGVTDLVRLRAAPGIATAAVAAGTAAAVALLMALGLGFGWHGLWIAAVVAAVAVAWAGGAHPWLLAPLPVAALVALLAGQHVPRSRPPVADWYESLEITGLSGVPVADAALALAVLVFLVQSANLVVRLVLTGAGPGVLDEERRLKGGRILGPLERVAIFALALGGNVAAISAVVAAKGILRFPEINRDAESGLKAEYVLVGSFVSWALALVFVPLF